MKVFCALIFWLIVPLGPSVAQIRSEDPVRAITQAFEVHKIVMVGGLHGNCLWHGSLAPPHSSFWCERGTLCHQARNSAIHPSDSSSLNLLWSTPANALSEEASSAWLASDANIAGKTIVAYNRASGVVVFAASNLWFTVRFWLPTIIRYP
jgi:hypothetical protein